MFARHALPRCAVEPGNGVWEQAFSRSRMRAEIPVRKSCGMCAAPAARRTLSRLTTILIIGGALYGMRRLCGEHMSASGAAYGLTWNPRQRGIVRRIRSPAKLQTYFPMLSRLNTRTACWWLSPLKFAVRLLLLLLMLILFLKKNVTYIHRQLMGYILL